MNIWTRYHEAVGVNPNRLLVESLLKFRCNRGHALDLGAGNLRDSRYLLARGFAEVTAVDRLSPLQEVPGVKFIVEPLEQYLPMPNTYDLVSCCNTLYFFREDMAVRIVTRAYNSLKADGLLVFNMHAPNDDWVKAGQGHYGVHETSLLSMLSGMPHKYIDRKTGPTTSALGKPRHGDTWKVYIRKPAH